jgi:magnesium transporter
MQSTRGDSNNQTPKKSTKRKKKRQRKRHNRRPSFLSAEDPESGAPRRPSIAEPGDMMAASQTKSQSALPFYKLGRDLSSTSLESEALLDHRYVVAVSYTANPQPSRD